MQWFDIAPCLNHMVLGTNTITPGSVGVIVLLPTTVSRCQTITSIALYVCYFFFPESDTQKVFGTKSRKPTSDRLVHVNGALPNHQGTKFGSNTHSEHG